ncbi:hypothetical protein ACFQX6_48430 [Streptosporangium lutulentum]
MRLGGWQSPAGQSPASAATTATGTPGASPSSSPSEDEKYVTGAFDYLYPDSPATGKDPVTVPLVGEPWRLAHLADYGVFDSLSRVVAPAEDDAWAFGQTETWKGAPFALRWDGWQWVRSALPDGLKGSVVDAGSAAPDDVWMLAAPRGPRPPSTGTASGGRSPRSSRSRCGRSRCWIARMSGPFPPRTRT